MPTHQCRARERPPRNEGRGGRIPLDLARTPRQGLVRLASPVVVMGKKVDWSPQRDRTALRLAAREKAAAKRSRRRKRNAAVSWLAAAGALIAISASRDPAALGSYSPVDFLADLLHVTSATSSAIIGTLGALSALTGGKKLLNFLSRRSQPAGGVGNDGVAASPAAKGGLTERQRLLLGLPPATPRRGAGETSPAAAPARTPTSGRALRGLKSPLSPSTINLADTPVRYDPSQVDALKKLGGSVERRSREHTPASAQRGTQGVSVMEGDGKISTPEQLDTYLKHLQSTLDSDLRSLSATTSPYGYGSPSVGDTFGYAMGSGTAPILPQYRASPPPVTAVKSPAEKSLASSWDLVENFLERSALTISLLEQTEDSLRQWFSSTVLHTLVDAIHSAHSEVERAAAQPGAACPVNVVPPAVRVLPLFLCPSVGLEEDVKAKGADRDQCLDKYQLEKWLEVLTKTPGGPQAQQAPAGGLGTSFFSSAPQQPQYDQKKRQVLIRAIQKWLGILLLLEGKCPGAKDLLPPFPKAYLNARIHEIASGTCVNEFRWSAGRSHVANRKWNRNDFPTDSNILCYLFCVYLSHPGWRFEGDFRKANPRTSFFVGALPHKPGEHFRAILPQTAVTKAKGHIILFQSRFGDPLYTLVTEGEEIRFSGHSGLFRGLALFLMLIRLRDHDWIGQNRLRDLGLSKVVCTDKFLA